MNSDKLENIYKFLSEYNFDTITNVPDKFKCGKCKKILIKACQTQCGCKFCRCCVDEMIKNECRFCPGITIDCKFVSLSTVQLDYRTINKISKLVMKCPEEMCSYECELLEMSEHLKICSKASLLFQFCKFDCDLKTITNEKLINYFELANYNNSKILIDNIKNEIKELTENKMKNHEEINRLNNDLVLTNENVDSINAEMEMMKIDKLEMEKRMENIEENLNQKIVNLIGRHEKEIHSIYQNDNIELIKTVLIEKINILVTYLDNKINEIESINKCCIKCLSDEIRLEMKEYTQSLDKLMMQMRIKPRINQLEKCIKNETNGIFELIINRIDKLKNHRGIWSEYFYYRIQPYKTRLYISHASDDELRICLCICDDEENQYLSFPFRANVRIKIINKTKREMFKSITKYCQIEKPENDSFILSDYFIYSLSELKEREILKLNCAIIQCSIELKC